MERMLKLKEVSEALNVPTSALLRWIRRDRFPMGYYRLPNNHVRVPEKELQEYLRFMQKPKAGGSVVRLVSKPRN